MFIPGELLLWSDGLLPSHVESWAKQWRQGRIDVSGNLRLAQAIYGSLYYLLSSVPTHNNDSWPYIGLSPGGLPFGQGTEVVTKLDILLEIGNDALFEICVC